MSRGLDGLQPWLRPWALWLIGQGAGYVQLTSVRRTYQQQVELYLAYQRGESKYPAAPPGYSYHEAGRAFDLIGPNDVLRRLGHLWEAAGGTWGARFGDPIHFQA